MTVEEVKSNTYVSAVQFLKENFESSDTLAVLLRNIKEDQTIQRIVTAGHLWKPHCIKWLNFMNSKGFDVFVSMNSLKPHAKGRREVDIKDIRHIYLDLDENGDESLKTVLNSTDLPEPNFVLNTSWEKFQVIWKVKGFEPGQAKRLMFSMVEAYHGDPAAKDISRVLRIPEFDNRKYSDPQRVTAEKLSHRTYVPSDFKLTQKECPQLPFKQSTVRSSRCDLSGAKTQSEIDWANTQQKIKQGENPEYIMRELERERQDKSNPAYYAALTVSKALVDVESSKGTHIHEVSAMLSKLLNNTHRSDSIRSLALGYAEIRSKAANLVSGGENAADPVQHHPPGDEI